MNNSHDDILLVDKPKGISSFDVIRILRRKYGIKKMGHAGTLDPAASGLMIIGMEKGTKKLSELTGLDKVYLIDVLIGIKTDSGDMEGKILENIPVKKELNPKIIEPVLKSLTGNIEIEVPIYSAIKFHGKPLYKYARENIEVPTPRRTVEIYTLRFISLKKIDSHYLLQVSLHCQKGTYARSIAQMIGEKLDLPSTVQDLRRTKIGNYDVNDAIKIEAKEFDFKQ